MDKPSRIRDATLAERLLLGLHASLPAALLACGLLQLFPPASWSAPAQRPLWAAWAGIGAWLALSLMLAALPRRLLLWRWALTLSAVLLLAAALAGTALHSAQALSFALALVLLGAVCAALAPALGPHRLREHWRAAPSPAHAQKESARRWPLPAWRRLWRALPFWVAGGLLLEAFRLAHIVAREPQRGTGMVGMLTAFFLLLPAATLAPWLPRSTAALAVAAAALHAWLGLRSGLPQWWAAAALSLLVAWHVLLRRRTPRPPGIRT
ncbi:hypothetical protein ACIPRI_11430 [Variovorax sp. LARHSF232]